MWLVLTTPTALAVGLALLIAGLRRTRRGLEPHCRACDFSLNGLGTVPRADLLCPECGKPVTEPKHVSLGTRARRPRLIIAGTACLAVGLLITTLFISALNARGAAVVPTILLVPQATLTDFSTPSVVMELDKRLKADELSNGQKQSLITAGLALQKEKITISPELAELLLDLLTSMTDDQCRRFVDQTLRLQLGTPNRLRQNGTLLLICDGKGLNSVSGGGSQPTVVDCRLVQARLGETPLLRGMAGRDPYDQHGVMPARLVGAGNFGAYYRFELTPVPESPPTFATGPTQLNTTWEFRARTADGKRDLTWRLERSLPITIVAPNENEFVPVSDTATRDALEKALAGATLYKAPGPPGSMYIRLSGQTLPVDVAFEIRVFDAEGKPVGAKNSYMSYDERNRTSGTSPSARLQIPADTAGPLRLELVPVKASNQNNVFGRVWTGEPIILKNVAIPQ